MTLTGIEQATFQFEAQRHNHCATAVPHIYIYIYIYIPYSTLRTNKGTKDNFRLDLTVSWMRDFGHNSATSRRDVTIK